MYSKHRSENGYGRGWSQTKRRAVVDVDAAKRIGPHVVASLVEKDEMVGLDFATLFFCTRFVGVGACEDGLVGRLALGPAG